MLVAVQSCLGGGSSSRRGWRTSRLDATRTRLVLVRSVRRLVLRIGRLGRGHPVVMHGPKITARAVGAHIAPRAVGPVGHQGV